MARYYFHLRTAAGLKVTDEYGDDLPDHDAAEHHAVGSAKDLMRASRRDWRQASFEIHDSDGQHVTAVWFRDVAAASAIGGPYLGQRISPAALRCELASSAPPSLDGRLRPSLSRSVPPDWRDGSARTASGTA